MNQLKKNYKEKIVAALQKELGIKNTMAAPKLSKVVLNMGVAGAVTDKKNVEKALEIMTSIAGQKPKITKAKKSISSFKLRQGDEIGLMVTLREKRMYEFMDKLIKVILPRLRDFHGVKRDSFDGKGNYTLGFSEYTVFPEIDLGKTDQSSFRQGLEVCIVTTGKNNKEGFALLEALGMPFQKVKS